MRNSVTVSVTGLVFPGAGVALGVHDQLPALERLGRVLLRGALILGREAPQHRFYTLDQQALRERLADEVVGPELEAEQLVDLLVLGGKEDHRQVGLLPQTPEEFHAVHARHLDVEDREVGRLLAQAVERRGAVGVGLDAVALGLERDGDRGEMLRSSSTRAMVGMGLP
jgi:hypothetical protein